MRDAEMLADVKAFDAPKAQLERGEDELIPFTDLAKASEVSRRTIAAIEAGHKKGGVETLKKLSKALKLDPDHLS